MKYVLVLLLSSVLATFPTNADEVTALKPLLVQPDKIVYQSDFSEAGSLNREEWKPAQGTRWNVQDGVLRGIESSPEHQSTHKGHRGLEPRLHCRISQKDFLIRFSIRFLGGEVVPKANCVEFGHHLCRVRFGEQGAELLADDETMRVAESKTFVLERGKWYHGLAERKGAEFVIQFADGPTLYAEHPCFASTRPGGVIFSVAGTRRGIVELGNVTIHSVKAKPLDSWEVARQDLPVYKPVQVRIKRKR